MIWKNDKAAKTRTSFKGCEQGVDYEATVKLYREKTQPSKRRINLQKERADKNKVSTSQEKETAEEEKEEVEG